MARRYWFTNNGKVNGHVWTYNVPAIVTCPSAPCNAADGGYCYAVQNGHWTMPGAVFAMTLRMWAICYAKDFEGAIVTELLGKTGRGGHGRWVRWHSSGDMFDTPRLPLHLGKPLRTYTDALRTIAERTAGRVQHYTYTKRADFLDRELFTNPPENFICRFSADDGVRGGDLARGIGMRLAVCVYMDPVGILEHGVQEEYERALSEYEGRNGPLMDPLMCPCTLDAVKREVIAADRLIEEGKPIPEWGIFSRARRRGLLPEWGSTKKDVAGYGRKVACIGNGKKEWVCSICNEQCSVKVSKTKADRGIRTCCSTSRDRDIVFAVHGNPTTGISRNPAFVRNVRAAWNLICSELERGMTMDQIKEASRGYLKEMYVKEPGAYRSPVLQNPPKDLALVDWLSPEDAVGWWDLHEEDGPQHAQAPREYLDEFVDALYRAGSRRPMRYAANPTEEYSQECGSDQWRDELRGRCGPNCYVERCDDE